METKIFSVSGMMCNACVGHVTKALADLEGVQKAEVRLEDNTATVTYDPAKVQISQMAEAAAEEGYELLV